MADVAILIPMRLVGRDDVAVEYDAGTTKGRVRLRMTTASGEVEVVEAESDADAATDFVVSRASKVLLALRGRGDYPAEMDYRH